MDEILHDNYVSLVISIHHNCFGISFIHTFQLVKSFIQTIHLFPIIIQKFIDVARSSKYFIHFVTFIHVLVVFIRHNCFGVSFIHTFQPVGSFIQTICLFAFIIQKFH